MESVRTLHIIGYKNSGKTTLITNWIKDLKSLGLKVAVIKHHGHGAKLAMPDENKDSMQYLTSGADSSIVSGGGFTQHMLHEELDFSELYAVAEAQNPDIILIEGYKREVVGAKVVLVKDDRDWESLQKLKHIALVVGLQENCEYPQVDARENRAALQSWLFNWLEDGKRDL